MFPPWRIINDVIEEEWDPLVDDFSDLVLAPRNVAGSVAALYSFV